MDILAAVCVAADYRKWQKKTINLGRFRRREGIRHIIERLSIYKGYELQIIDTKKLQGREKRLKC